jgi:hypothetical protein
MKANLPDDHAPEVDLVVFSQSSAHCGDFVVHR